MSWRDRAACAGRTEPPIDLPRMSLNDRRRIARWYCLECPVKRECADDALDRGDVGVIRAGVWCSPHSGGVQTKTTRATLEAVAT